MPSKLVEALMRFNRKERFWLLSDALGTPFRDLDPTFLRRVSEELSIEIPQETWWAFDYHLDWLHAVLSSAPTFEINQSQSPRLNDTRYIKGTQEDIDLLIAFDQTGILVEAKLDTSWSNKQMTRKAERFRNLPVEHVRMHLLLTSPAKTARLVCADWPAWARKDSVPPSPNHIALTNGHATQGALMVSRCDSAGKKNRDGEYWSIFEA